MFMSDLTKLAKEQLKDVQGFMKANNYEVLKVSENYCELEGKITDTSLNPYGIAHGGYIFGLADTAAGIASRTDGRIAVTCNSSIDYLKSCKGSKIKAVAKCLKNGNSISVYEVHIYDEDENLVARVNVSYFYVKNEK